MEAFGWTCTGKTTDCSHKGLFCGVMKCITTEKNIIDGGLAYKVSEGSKDGYLHYIQD